MTDSKFKTGRGKALANTLQTPLYLFGAIILLITVGYMSIVYFRDQELPIIIFTLGSVVVFHILLWLLRKRTDDKGLRIVDYVYLSLAFLGVGGIVDVQATIAREQYQSIIATYMPELESLKPCKDASSPECKLSEAFLASVSQPDPLMFRFVSQMRSIFSLEFIPFLTQPKPDVQKFNEKLGVMMDLLSKEVGPSLRSGKTRENRFIAFYVLAIGLALRFTKVSAELFKWHRAKDQPAGIAIDNVNPC